MKQIEKEKNLITADVPPAKEVPRKNKVQRKDLKEQNDLKDIIKKQLRELNDHNKVQFNKQGKGKRTKARRGSQDNYLDDIKKSLLNMRRQIEDHLYGRTKKGTVQGGGQDKDKPRSNGVKELRDIAFMRNVKLIVRKRNKDKKNKRENRRKMQEQTVRKVTTNSSEMGKGEEFINQQGGLHGGGQNEGSSYAKVLTTGLQGGGKDGNTSRRNSNPVTNAFLRFSNPIGSNACFANSVMQLLQKSDLIEQEKLIEDPEKPLCSALAKLYKQKEEVQAKMIRTLVARISGKKQFEEVGGRGTQEDASSFLESLEQIITSELASTGHRGELSYNRSFTNQPEGRCPRCNTTPRPRTEPFLQLAVPIPASGLNHSLGSILAKFFAPNTETENIKCSTCCIHDGTGQKCTCSRVPSEEKTLLSVLFDAK